MVGNNGSIDDTKKFLEKLKDVKIINLKENNGINSIIFRLANEAKGKYLWLLGDDDFLVGDIVDIVMNKIKEFKDIKHSFFITGRKYIFQI